MRKKVYSMVDFLRLQNSIMDVLAEQQLKIGYMDESIGLYYPLESLRELLDVDANVEQMTELLMQFCEITENIFGFIFVSEKNERFCLRIPPKGGAYVHERIAQKSDEKYLFLQDFLNAVVKHNQTIDDFLRVFYKYSECVVVRKMADDEFDYLVYFEDNKPDDYRYCIKFEGKHTTYHRFSNTDFHKFGLLE